jgi:hypothetical protein
VNEALTTGAARVLYVLTWLLFLGMPVWIFLSSFFTFLAGFFLVPLYIPIWVILRWLCRLLLSSRNLRGSLVPMLQKSVLRNTRALRYNVILSIPALVLFVGYLAGRGAI